MPGPFLGQLAVKPLLLLAGLAGEAQLVDLLEGELPEKLDAGVAWENLVQPVGPRGARDRGVVGITQGATSG